MIGFFPPLYEDELIYSWLARYVVHSGYSSIADVYTELFGRKTISPSMMLMNNMTNETVSVLSRYKPLRELILHHTMFPEYARFVDPEKRNLLLAECDLTKGNWSSKAVYTLPGTERKLRYCPECAREDRERYGETYWHRAHQITNIKVCTKHKKYLLDSIVVVSWSNTRLKNADIMIPADDKANVCEDKTILSLAGYLEAVFYSDTYCNDRIGLFINESIDKVLKHNNGDCKLYALYDEYKAFYTALGGDIMTIDYMSKLLRGYKGAYYYICQMGLFEGITVDFLLSGSCEIDDKRMFRIVAERLDEPIETVERIGAAILDEYKRNGVRTTRKGRCEKKIEDDDRRLLTDVKKITAEIYGYDDKRPGKVTAKAVSRALGIDFHRLKKMRSCMDEINHYYETQEQYWAREIIWAVEQIRNNNEPLNYKHIRNCTNLRKEDLGRCMYELEGQDDDIYQIVYKLL